MANTSVEVVLGMVFLALSKVKVDFAERELTWKAYTIAKVLLTTKRVQIISPKEFAKAALDPDQEAFVVYIATIFNSIEIHPDREVQIATLIADKALVTIPAEYLDFEDVFSKKSAALLPEHTKINTHAIDLQKSKQLLYGPIYSLGPVELKTLKIYIETNLANSFICLSKSPTSALILFDKNSNRSLQLCVNYWGLNNITLKNRYQLLLVGESLDCLGRAK